jgi:hypothetical protein
MRNDLRELARLAAPAPAAAPHGFDDADSSGYVDLSAYSTRDPRWVERELARAKAGSPPPLPPRSRAIDVLTPASMAPVALESFVLKDDEDDDSPRPSRARRVLYGLGALASIGVVGYLAVVLARHPPQPATSTQAAAPLVVAPPAVDPAPPVSTAAVAVPPVAANTPATAGAGPATTTGAAASPLATAASSPPAAGPVTGKGKGKGARGTRAHASAHAAAAPPPVHVAAAARPAVIPASHPSGGGDSLMDLIKKSVATGK